MLYVAYGLCIRSDFALPSLSPINWSKGVKVDVEVRKLAIPRGSEERSYEHHCELKPHSASLSWPNVGNFQVRQGREIIIEPAQEVAEHRLGAYVLGAALPILLLQRGLFVLHSSAVALRAADGLEYAIAFMGHSGQGKSTMATALHRRGWRVLADDTIALAVSQQEAPSHQAPLVYPSLPHLKLRAPSVVAFGEETANLPRWQPDDDSFVLRLPPERDHEPAPLKCFYVLEDSPSLEVQPLALPQALMLLMQHAYSMGLLPGSEMGNRFEECVQIVQRIPVFKLRRPRDYNRLPEVVRLVEEHQNSLTSHSKSN